MNYRLAIATLLGLGLTQFAIPVQAEGLASRTKALPGITASECIAEVDRVAARQSQDNDGVVRSASARKIIYQNPYGSITIACL
ncbi:MAG: hypothetical protein F6J87_25600, partial [Spirulina sp. SIO3F2]|nr:hypothetical protein [Spirulina sp. SIO3F2]